MKLLRARIENFHLLKEIEFKFATSKSRNLTVVRAANESGKTTLLTALQWGLFGEDALPQPSSNYRLCSFDASSGDKVTIKIRVEIDYETSMRVGGSRVYRLIRFATETVQGVKWVRESTHIKLLHMTSSGEKPIDNPESEIRQHFPKELREVFFTDGDRALNFIEGKKGDQKKQIESVIRSLLGFSVIEKALEHVGKVRSDINQKVRKSSNIDEIDSITEKLSELQKTIPELEEDLKLAKEARVNLESLAQEADAKLSDALRKGNREDLERQRKEASANRQLAEKDAVQATRDHADLFRSELLGKHFLAEPFQKSGAILDELRRKGEIPNQTIPVLEDRLNQLLCICGESLDKKTSDGKKRRKQIQNLIEDSRNVDKVREKITALFFRSQDLREPVEGRGWIDEYSRVFERRQRANKQKKKHGEIESEVDAKIARLPDVDVEKLHTTKNQYQNQAMTERDKEIRLKIELETKLKEIKAVEEEQERMLQKNKQGKKLSSELQVTKDLQDIMNNALETMKTRELMQVSKHMNSLFLNMIGSDTSQSSTITRAEITPEFRIVVFSRHEVPLDPSQNLNGASRRALTIAFILALTKISEVEAPNVIDTPLGMTSGYVKTAILRLATKQSSQLVLFLTHDEIKGCEDILDEYGGKVYTFTNPSHYPKILVNDPNVDDTRILLCNCNHRGHCKTCQRREAINVDVDLN